MPVLIALVVAAAVSATLFGAITSLRRSHDPGNVEEDEGAAKVGAIVAEHTWLKRFLLERRDPQKETGLLLTIAIAFIFAAILAIGALLLMVRQRSGFARWDASAARFGAEQANSAASSVMKVITELGTSRNVIGVAVVVGGYAAWKTRRLEILAYLLTTVLSTMLVNNAVKWIVDRPRPNLSRLVSHAGSSFPSGHTAAAAATYAAVALVLGRGKHRRVKAALATTAGVITVSVAASRVLLGVHWVTDVAAGAAMGWACFAVTSIAFGGRALHFGRPVEVAQQVADRVQDDATAHELVPTHPRITP